VILCRTGKAEEALRRLRELMGKLKLTVNEEKTRICKVPEGWSGAMPSGEWTDGAFPVLIPRGFYSTSSAVP
jgi:hypothetical protein